MDSQRPLSITWRRLAPIAALLLTALVVCGALLIQQNTLAQIVVPPEEPARGEQTNEWHRAVLDAARDGDWLVLRGYHHTDNLVAAATNQPFSHVAVLDIENDCVIEAMAEGVRVMDLRERIHESHHVMVMRPRWSDAISSETAIVEARELVGVPYDMLGTVGLGSRDRFYCSELAIHIYRESFSGGENFSGVIEPGHMYLWGEILYDSRTRG
jgi:hypothetical protein